MCALKAGIDDEAEGTHHASRADHVLPFTARARGDRARAICRRCYTFPNLLFHFFFFIVYYVCFVVTRVVMTGHYSLLVGI